MSSGLFKTKIRGTGHCLPERILSNHDLEKMVETTDQWIFERTGIKERRLTPVGLSTSDLALVASRNALEAADLKPEDIEMILFATVSPDQMMPNTACVLQNKLGCGPCVAWDLNAACSGFVYGASVANQYIKTGMYKNILVVGAEVLSRIVNYKDRETCILFGDGAGAVVFGRAEKNEKSEILAESLFSDGNLGDLLTLPSSGVKIPPSHEAIDQGLHHITMKGREIFKNAVRTMSRCASATLESQNLSGDDLDWVIPHQANQRIIESVAKQLEIPMEKFIMNLARTGNTSSASVPIALDEAVRAGQLKRGDLCLMVVFGAGLTSGSILMRY